MLEPPSIAQDEWRHRRLRVRKLLAMSRAGQAARYLEEAGDICLTFLHKRKLALILYRQAALNSEHPASLLRTIIEIAEQEENQQLVSETCDTLLGLVSSEEASAIYERQQLALSRIQRRDDIPRAEEHRELYLLAKKACENVELRGVLRPEALRHLVEGKPSHAQWLNRLEIVKQWLVQDLQFQDELLATLRDSERYDAMTDALRLCIAHVPPERARALRLQLGHALRFCKGDLKSAADAFEELIKIDSSDREAFGELLECLDELGEDARLASILQRRIEATAGLERQVLARQRELVLERLKSFAATQSAMR